MTLGAARVNVAWKVHQSGGTPSVQPQEVITHAPASKPDRLTVSPSWDWVQCLHGIVDAM